MITVLQFVHKYRGNYELFNLQAGLDRRRFRMVVCYLSGVPDGRDRLAATADKVIHLQCRPDRLHWYNLPLLVKMRQVIDAERPQVINCQQHRTISLGVLASLLSRSRPILVATLHGLGTAKTWKRQLFNRLFYRRLFRIVAISDGVAKDIVASNRGLSADKVVTIQNGLDYRGFLADVDPRTVKAQLLPGKEGAFWFGTAGRLSPVKNHATLIDAFALVATERPDSILVIAGEGELAAPLQSLVEERGLAERVFFLGFRRDMPQVLQAFDLFLLPSLREGLPLALLEALASGRAVVAAQVGGIPEVVGDGTFARLVDPQDPSAMAAAMLELAALSSAKRRDLGEAARQHAVTRFSAARMIAGYEAVYAQAFSLWQQQNNGG